jgi:hypothetical protein
MPTFLPRYREACKLPPGPRWSPSQGPSTDRVTPWIALGLFHAQVGLWQASPRPLPTIFTIKLSAKPQQALFPLVHGGDHTINTVCVDSQDYKPLWCTTLVCASTELSKVCKLHLTLGLNLEKALKWWSNSSQSTYANH